MQKLAALDTEEERQAAFDTTVYTFRATCKQQEPPMPLIPKEDPTVRTACEARQASTWSPADSPLPAELV